MQVDTIKENQPQFKGILVLHNTKQTTLAGEKLVEKIGISSENVSKIIPIAKLPNEVFSTLIRTNDKEEYSVRASFETVLDAYKQTAFSNNIAELDAYTMEASSEYFG